MKYQIKYYNHKEAFRPENLSQAVLESDTILVTDLITLVDLTIDDSASGAFEHYLDSEPAVKAWRNE